MADRFNRASFLQGSVSPVAGGGVRVPLDDPQNKVLAQGLGTLANRLDTFKSTAFKVAGAQAKAAGTAYGARNAPTQEQLVKANELGMVIDLPGDASSMNIFNQAAYAGSLSLLEDSVEIAGRKALTDAMAEAAADPNLDPTTFTAKLDTIVGEYSAQMATVSPTSAGKVNSSLGMVANSQVVSFSREFMARAIKQRTNEAKENVNTIINGAPTTITGHTADGDVTLLESLKINRGRIRSVLEKAPNVTEDYIVRQENRFDKKIKAAQEAVVLNWARTTESLLDNPTGAARELLKLDSNQSSTIPNHIKDVWKITDVETRNNVFDSLTVLAGKLNKLDEIETARGKQDRLTIINNATNAFNKAMTASDTAWAQRANGMRAQINILNSIGAPTTELQEIVDRGPITRIESNVADKLRLVKAKAMGRLSLKMVMDAQLNEDDSADFMNDLTSQRDGNVRKALATIKNDPLFRDIDFNSDGSSDNTKTSALRRRYNQAQNIVYKKRKEFEDTLGRKIQTNQEIKSTDYFNANEIAEDAVKTVRGQILNEEIETLQRRVDKGYKILEKLKVRGVVFSQSAQGLRDALESKTTSWLGTESRRYKKNSTGKYFSDGSKLNEALKSLESIAELERRLNALEND